MGFSISMRNVAAPRDYARADKHFNETKKPRTSRWAEHQRPLRNTAARHLRIEKGRAHGVNYYDMCLFDTALIRYYEPHADGSQAVHIRDHYSQSSHTFLGAHGWHGGRQLRRDDNTAVSMPLSHETGLAHTLWGDDFTTRLVLHPNGTLDMKRSVHIPFFRRKSSTTLRAKRARVKEALSVVMDLVEFKYGSALDEVALDIRGVGRPFAGRGKHNSNVETRHALALIAHGEDTSNPDALGVAVKYAMDSIAPIIEHIASQRAYKMSPLPAWYRKAQPEDQRKEAPVDGERVVDQAPTVREQITPSVDAVKRALLEDFYSLAGVARPDEAVPYPQFAADMARVVHASGLHRSDEEGAKESFGIETYHKLVNRKENVY